MDNIEYSIEGLKDMLEKETSKEEEETTEQTEGNIDLTVTENEKVLKGTYGSFVIPGTPKTEINGYLDQPKPHTNALIEEQLKKMQSAKVIVTVWLRWKKSVKLAFTLDPKHVEGAQDIEGNTGDNYIKVEMPFDTLMAELFEGSNTKELIQCMFTHIKTQIENAQMPESGFTLDQIMFLHINFHKVEMMQGSSYIALPGWIAKKEGSDKKQR